MPVIEKPISPNLKQEECINSINGTLMVLAGPGTGKTYTLIKRIENMLKNDVKPENILCLTFSETAASEMKNRLIRNIGVSASNTEIGTYHAFCNNIIRLYPSKFELFDNVNLIDNISQISLMKQATQEIELKFLTSKWGNKYYYIKPALKAIAEIKQNQITKEKFFEKIEEGEDWQILLQNLEKTLEERIKQGKTKNITIEKNIETQKKKIGKAKELWILYENYDKKMKEKNFIDFNDMLNFVVETFDTDEIFLKKVTQNYKYILVDEYQDTNYLQNRLIELIAKGANTKNIFVVGDDDQIIYGFQGAKSDNMENFIKNNPGTKLICLNENNRSTQSILDFSYNLISQDKSRLEFNPEFSTLKISKKLTAKNADMLNNEKPVELNIYTETAQEYNCITEKIDELIKSGIEPSKIAILTRETKELIEFARLFSNKNINFQMKITKSIFELKPSILIYFYLKTLNNAYLASDKLFGLLMSEPFNFENEDYNFLLSENKPTKKNFIDIIRENSAHRWKNKEKINEFMNTYNKLFSLKSHLGLSHLIYEVINQTKILYYYSNCEINKFENILAIKRVLDEAKSFESLNQGSDLAAFIQHLDTAIENEIPIEIEQEKQLEKNSIQLSTIHSSKGREFYFVFMPNLISTKWEKKSVRDNLSLPINNYLKTEEEKNSENIKLLFVGATRAKHSLFLSFAKENEGKSQNLTTYISSISKECKSLKTNEIECERDFYTEIAKSMTKEEFNHHLVFENELKQRLSEHTMSAHSMNSYLNCPRNFLYEYAYKIPVYDTNSNNANFGSAIHKMLEFISNYAIESGLYPKIEQVKKVFKDKLDSFSFENETIYEQFLNRGMNAIDKYFPQIIQSNISQIFAIEHSIKDIEFETTKLKGFIDRIEKFNDGTYGLFDYKTGDSKTEKQISDGGDYEKYLNQLRFYKFIFELKYPEYKVSQVGLIFLEADKNVYLKLTNEDDELLKEKIKTVKNGIENLKFDPINQNLYNECSNCKYCNYKMICKLDVL